MEKERFIWVDWVKSLGIYLVVLGHYDLSNKDVTGYIFMFHMALFFFISGFLMSESTMTMPWTKFLKKKINSLVLPYLLYNIICGIWPTMLLATGRTFNYDDLLIGTFIGMPLKMFCGPAWFLLALFWCNIFLRLNKFIVSMPLLALILLLRYYTERSFPLCIDTVPLAFLFFAFAYYFKSYILRVIQWTAVHKLITGLLIPVSFFIVGIVYFNIGQQNLLLANVTHHPLLSITTAFLAIYATLALGVLLSSGIRLPLITTLSNSTLFIMCMHMQIISFVSTIMDIQSNMILALFSALVIALGLAVVTPYLHNKFPILMGYR